jgi:hypothetical protein
LNACFWAGIALLVAGYFPDLLSRVLATIVIGFAAIVISLELLSIGNAIRLGPVASICGITLALGAFARRRQLTGWLAPPSDTAGKNFAATTDPDNKLIFAGLLVPGFAIWAALDCLLYGLFTPVQADSDAPIYHLPFAIHWARVGNLDFVSTPFGEEGAPYFPANGDLWLTWLTVTSGFAEVIKVGQWPFLVIGGVGLYGISREVGASPGPAAIASAIWCCLPLTLRQSSVANVDLIWTAFYFIALFFVLRYRDAARCRVDVRRELWLAALALGIVLGTKSVALVFAPLLVVPLLWMIWIDSPSGSPDSPVDSPLDSDSTRPASPKKHREIQRLQAVRLQEMGLLIIGVGLPWGYWLARNFWMTGNPLYPLDVSCFNHRILTGWYDTSAMRETAYHIRVYDWPELERRLVYTAGPCLLGLWFVCVISGVLGAIWSFGKNTISAVRLLSVLALLQVGIYWFIVPYNSQERFLLPTLGIGLVPLSRGLSKRPWLLGLVGLVFAGHVSLALFGGATTMDDVSFRTLRKLLEIGSGWRGPAFVGCLVVAGTMAFQRRWFDWIVASAAIIIGCVLYGAPLASLSSRNPERSFYPEIGFGARMLPAWQIMERASRVAGARIAYAGGNLPYYLLGSGYRNDAVYVNINRHRDWLPHDYHKARALRGDTDKAAIPWPQWYREEAEYEAWLENLRAQRIDLLFVTRTNLHGRLADLRGDLPPFPIERTWADTHPDEFEYLGPQPATGGPVPWACVYRLRMKSGDRGASSE